MSKIAHQRDTWEWYGSAGHFICAPECRFHLATKVGPWLVSTVGEYFPDAPIREIKAEVRGVVLEDKGDARRADYMRKIGFADVGYGRKYETMVFPVGDTRCTADDCDCGMPEVTSWSELDADGYNLRGDAQRGHYAMCEKWSRVADLERP